MTDGGSPFGILGSDLEGRGRRDIILSKNRALARSTLRVFTNEATGPGRSLWPRVSSIIADRLLLHFVDNSLQTNSTRSLEKDSITGRDTGGKHRCRLRWVIAFEYCRSVEARFPGRAGY